MAVADARHHVVEIADTAGSDHRHRHRIGNRAGERDIEAEYHSRMVTDPSTYFTATKRLGNDQSRLSQIKDGKWVVVKDYVKP